LQSFFDGWDVTKKKDKTKGRHDSLLSRKYSCMLGKNKERKCKKGLNEVDKKKT